jgi:hypothetical protein
LDEILKGSLDRVASLDEGGSSDGRLESSNGKVKGMS